MNFRAASWFAAACLLAAVYASGRSQAAAQNGTSEPPLADLVIINADIRTMDPRAPRASAVAITGNKITAVGNDAAIRRLAGAKTELIDARGRLVLPGFNDAHVHFAALGNTFSSLAVRESETGSDLLARVAYYVEVLPAGRWIRGIIQSRDPQSIWPGRDAIDRLTPNNPIFLATPTSSAAFVNRAALEKAGLDPSSPELASGMVTGDAMRRVAGVLPQDHIRRWPEILETAGSHAARNGVTSVQNMDSDELASVYRDLDSRGRLKTRIYDCSPPHAIPRLAAAGVKAATGSAMVRTGCIKHFSEGEESEREQLAEMVRAADAAGLQVMIHAMDAQANSIALDVLGSAIDRTKPRDRRFRVEHAYRLSPADLRRFKASGIVASMQPWLFYPRPQEFGRLLRDGATVAFGSDASMVELDPLLGVHAAVSLPGGVSVEEAVRAYTITSAFAEFQEKVKGSITVGKLADIVMLSRNIFLSKPTQIRDSRVLLTIMDGRIVYRAANGL